ncbi:MAG: biopolymer transporter ExbD [Pseudomonadota bacterium]|nr:biopolymer transporter ExbD [Pseudomonadota bacterium]
MGARLDSGDDIVTDINVTPLVDVVLVVLVIYMVTASALEKQALPVDLPRASTGEQVEAPRTLAVTLDGSGQIAVDGVASSAEAFVAAVREAHRSSAGLTVLVAADTHAEHGRVVWVLDTVRAEGIDHFALQIDPAGSVAPR